jgi:hypothetical protein
MRQPWIKEKIRKEMDKVMQDFVKEYPNIHFFNGVTDEEINEFVKIVLELQEYNNETP